MSSPSAAQLLARRGGQWLQAAETRISVRVYDDAPVGAAEADQIDTVCDHFRPYGGARSVLLRRAPSRVFTGIVGAYGKVSAPSALVFIGRVDDAAAQAAVGYVGEAAILEAARLGLDSCWIGGGLDRPVLRRVVRLARDERVYAIAAIGRRPSGALPTDRAAALVGARKRLGVERIAKEFGDTWPAWAKAGVEAARLSPSASNRQPWRFSYAEGTVLAAYAGFDASVVPKRLDCGIAMLHFVLGARAAGCKGTWELSDEGRQVGRFVVEGSLVGS